MRSFATTDLWLNKARKNNKGLIPIKIRVTHRRKTKYYKIGYYLTEKKYMESFMASRPRGTNFILKAELKDFVDKSEAIIKGLNPFTFEKWERLFFESDYDQDNVVHHYRNKIQECGKSEKYSSEVIYKHSLEKVVSFFVTSKGSALPFSAITPKKLAEFERWMLEDGYSISTVGIYLRCLRHIFNNAIANGDIPSELYPFGNRIGKYRIPNSRNIKKGLPIETIRDIKELELTMEPHLEKARDFWLLSFFLQGINH